MLFVLVVVGDFFGMVLGYHIILRLEVFDPEPIHHVVFSSYL